MENDKEKPPTDKELASLLTNKNDEKKLLPILDKFSVKYILYFEAVLMMFYILNLAFGGNIGLFDYHREVIHTLLSTNVWKSTVVITAPIMITAIGAAFNERAGVINIGLEGIMLLGAWIAIFVTIETNSPLLGIIAAVIMGALLGFIHALFTITLKSEQIVTGVAINLFAAGFTKMLSKLVYGGGESSPLLRNAQKMERYNIFDTPLLGDIAKLLSITEYGDPKDSGSIFYFIPDLILVFNTQIMIIYLLIVITIFANILLFHTSFGLRIRVIGDHPQAAATAGISVRKYQYIAVIISGIFAALGGATIAFQIRQFSGAEMIGGRGFLALAAMIFGKWNVIGSVFASIIFGYFYNIGISSAITIDGFEVPFPFFNMLPFVATILVLSGFMGRATPPKRLGKPYDPTED